MRVEKYNEGRTPSDVSDKTWVHGTRKHLRPDTMWADERYSKITQAEIVEAKKRVAAREAGKHDKHDDHHHHKEKLYNGLPLPNSHPHGHYDFKHQPMKQPRELYP